MQSTWAKVCTCSYLFLLPFRRPLVSQLIEIMIFICFLGHPGPLPVLPSGWSWRKEFMLPWMVRMGKYGGGSSIQELRELYSFTLLQTSGFKCFISLGEKWKSVLLKFWGRTKVRVTSRSTKVSLQFFFCLFVRQQITDVFRFSLAMGQYWLWGSRED